MDASNYQEALSTAEKFFSRKLARPGMPMESKQVQKVKEEPQIVPKPEELPLTIENGIIVCNFEFACYLTKLLQKAVGMPVILTMNLASTNR